MGSLVSSHCPLATLNYPLVCVCVGCLAIDWCPIEGEFSHLAPSVREMASGSSTTLTWIKCLLEIDEWMNLDWFLIYCLSNVKKLWGENPLCELFWMFLKCIYILKCGRVKWRASPITVQDNVPWGKVSWFQKRQLNQVQHCIFFRTSLPPSGCKW